MNNNPQNSFKALITITGLGLIAAGAYVFYFILNELFQIFIAQSPNLFIKTISETLSNKVLYIGPDESPFIIGQGAAETAGFIFTIILASCAGNIAASLIKSGIKIVSPTLNSDIQWIKDKLDTITDK